jgi:hypothetical protein
MQDNNREKGLALLKKLHGGHTGEEIFNVFEDVSPKMAVFSEFVEPLKKRLQK